MADQPESDALREARAIATSVADDEAAATAARREHQTNGLPTLEPPAEFALLALPGEVLHATRAKAVLERTLVDAAEPLPQAGALYITSERLVHAGADATGIPLGEIDEMAVAFERLLLVRLRDGTDLAIETDRPRLLRVQIAAALAATRVSEVAEPSTAATGQPESQSAGQSPG